MGVALIGFVFGAAGLPVWLLILAIVWHSLGRFEQELSALEKWGTRTAKHHLNARSLTQPHQLELSLAQPRLTRALGPAGIDRQKSSSPLARTPLTQYRGRGSGATVQIFSLVFAKKVVAAASRAKEKRSEQDHCGARTGGLVGLRYQPGPGRSSRM